MLPLLRFLSAVCHVYGAQAGSKSSRVGPTARCASSSHTSVPRAAKGVYFCRTICDHCFAPASTHTGSYWPGLAFISSNLNPIATGSSAILHPIPAHAHLGRPPTESALPASAQLTHTTLFWPLTADVCKGLVRQRHRNAHLPGLPRQHRHAGARQHQRDRMQLQGKFTVVESRH